MAQLHDLVSFLDKNSSLELSLSQRPGSDSHALLKEKQSLQWVRGLLGDSLQLLGLWSIVVDHQVKKRFSILHLCCTLCSLDDFPYVPLGCLCREETSR